MNVHRRNPLRLVISKEIQLRILQIVGGAVFFCLVIAGLLWNTASPWLWNVVLMLAVGCFVSLWASRKIAGPLYRIEKDLEAILSGALDNKSIHIRDGDPMEHLTELVNRLLEKTRRQK